MPIDHEIVNDKFIIVTAFDTVTGAELSDHVFTLVNLLGISLRPGYRQIFDATRVKDLKFNEEDMKHISHIVLNHGQDRGRIAIAFAATNEKVKEMIGYYMRLCEVTDVHAKLFDDRGSANDWLLAVEL